MANAFRSSRYGVIAFCRSLFLVFLSVATLTVPIPAKSFVIDTSGSAISGLWWNPSESGWGLTLTQQYGVIFVAIYTYDNNRNPIWYVVSNCAVVAGGCSGDLYKVTGGSSPTIAWGNPDLGVTTVGAASLTFADNNNATMNYTINGVASSKVITRQIFATAPPALNSEDKTLLMVGLWSMYTADRQSLLSTYTISSSDPRQGVNGWFIHGTNPHPYSGFPSFLAGTAVQAGFNTTTSKYYVIDLSAEQGFVWEYSFDAVGPQVTGCRFRYPSSSSDRGSCVAIYATHS